MESPRSSRPFHQGCLHETADSSASSVFETTSVAERRNENGESCPLNVPLFDCADHPALRNSSERIVVPLPTSEHTKEDAGEHSALDGRPQSSVAAYRHSRRGLSSTHQLMPMFPRSSKASGRPVAYEKLLPDTAKINEVESWAQYDDVYAEPCPPSSSYDRRKNETFPSALDQSMSVPTTGPSCGHPLAPAPCSIDIDAEPLLPNDFVFFAARGDRYHGTPFLDGLVFRFRTLLWRLKMLFCAHRVSTVERTVALTGETSPKFLAPNIIRNQRYNILTLIPCVLLTQFRFFFNVFYMGVALAQLIPQLRIGPLFTYIAPLSFVLTVTIIKEGYDDYQRYLRDKETNGTVYEVLDVQTGQLRSQEARYIRVGHILRLHANQRVPCDVLLLRAPRPAGTTFIRTDQLDGETDWKLRRPVATTQALPTDHDLQRLPGWVVVEPPRRDIYEFVGNFYTPRPPRDVFRRSVETAITTSTLTNRGCTSSPTLKSVGLGELSSGPQDSESPYIPGIHGGVAVSSAVRELNSPKLDTHIVANTITEPLALENMLWGSTVVTSGPVWVLVVYTGSDSRAVLNTSAKRTKMGIFDSEINTLSKTLFLILVLVAAVLIVLKGLSGIWFIYFARFVLLLSSIIPISLRVNLDLAKTYYSRLITTDPKLDTTVVRNSSMPEELGRIDILLTDKTGTLTKNDMVLKKLHIGRAVFTLESLPELRHFLESSLRTEADAPASSAMKPDMVDGATSGSGLSSTSNPVVLSRRRLDLWEKLRRTLVGLGVCHNVTPIQDEMSDGVSFQASSPDEMAIVTFVAAAGLNLVGRTDTSLTLVGPDGHRLEFELLFTFPFSSETKRMGCIVRHRAAAGQHKAPLATEEGRLLFFLKGAESVMLPRMETRGAHWLQEECDNFARTGLRTLVIAMRELDPAEFQAFCARYAEAQKSLRLRADRLHAAVASLEKDMTLLALTGVEDRLQEGVPQTLEAFRHAGIHVWMLTGDKIETATCVAVSAGLKGRQHTLLKLAGADFTNPTDAQEAVETFAAGPTETVLVVDGPFIDMALKYFPVELITAASQAPATICCRCSPTQKADITRLIQTVTGKRTAAVGDGGNDVSMIQAANCGIGIVGKEGKQASLAADFSISQFQSLHRLLFWHGRNCYQRSAKLAQFVMHRGLVIATIQVIFSAVFFFIPLAIFQGWLTVGYATYYTMLPVFSLVLDIELSESVVFMFPELYESLRRGRVMSQKTFFSWLWTSVYQGAVIMLGAIILFESEFINIVSITFTSLVLAELLNVASETTTWHGLMIIAEIATAVIYFVSMVLLPNYFNLSFICTSMFWWKVGAITLISWLPLYSLKMLLRCLQPTRDSKLMF